MEPWAAGFRWNRQPRQPIKDTKEKYIIIERKEKANPPPKQEVYKHGSRGKWLQIFQFDYLAIPMFV